MGKTTSKKIGQYINENSTAKVRVVSPRAVSGDKGGEANAGRISISDICGIRNVQGRVGPGGLAHRAKRREEGGALRYRGGGGSQKVIGTAPA